MASPLTFSIKFEFLLAYMPCNLRTPYAFARRNVRFPSTSNGSQDVSKFLTYTTVDENTGYTSSQAKNPLREAAIREVAHTLEGSNLLVNQQDFGGYRDSFDTRAFWSIRPNEKVKSPANSKYSFIGLEISSSTYDFCQDAIGHIRVLCPLMANTYLMHTNNSCGMHVKVGIGREGSVFRELKSFAALFWAYEPQIESLVHPVRTNKTWATSMRDYSNLQMNYQLSHEGRRPTSAVSIVQIMSTKDASELVNLIGHGDPDKHGNINFSHINAVSNEKWKETIEFRGHVISFDTEEVVNCVEMWVGIVDHVRNISPEDFYHLLAIVGYFETWEMMGDGKDSERERAKAPS